MRANSTVIIQGLPQSGGMRMVRHRRSAGDHGAVGQADPRRGGARRHAASLRPRCGNRWPGAEPAQRMQAGVAVGLGERAGDQRPAGVARCQAAGRRATMSATSRGRSDAQAHAPSSCAAAASWVCQRSDDGSGTVRAMDQEGSGDDQMQRDDRDDHQRRHLGADPSQSRSTRSSFIVSCSGRQPPPHPRGVNT